MFFEKLFLGNVSISQKDIISMKAAKVQIKWEDNQTFEPLNSKNNTPPPPMLKICS
jgi:hypothetical protein